MRHLPIALINHDTGPWGKQFVQAVATAPDPGRRVSWRIMSPAGHPVVRVTGAPAELSELAAEFPGYEFATQQTWDGISIIARRHGGCARPGLYAVVANDLDEMRRVLLEQERPS